MGVPAFYRWLSERYPLISVKAKETRDPTDEDLTSPNPNEIEFDNLYLDMNCMVHPCTHPEDSDAPLTEEDMFTAIFSYLDRLFSVIRPRKVLFLAIDGVAPRAKMNQQRSRRFRSAQEAEEAEQDVQKLRDEIIKNGRIPPPEKPKEWDSNVITPGTPFMWTLARRIREYICVRQNHSAAWKNLKVIFSDGNSPGEGEHKIMDFIRSQRAQKGYDPNTRHCLYGLDADLIMLGLATHEPNFTILREEVLFGKQNKKSGFSVDQVLLSSQRRNKEMTLSDLAIAQYESLKAKEKLKPFCLLHLWVLREYLAIEFHVSHFRGDLKFEHDLERIIDDFVFLCFFMGNDFLPHLPTLSIREGGLELMIDLYKRFLPTLDGYLTDSGVINLQRVDIILKALSQVEDAILQKRRFSEKRNQRRRLENNVQNKFRNNNPYNQKPKEIDFFQQYSTTPDETDEKAIKGAKLLFEHQLRELNHKRNKFEVVETASTKNKSNVIVDEVRLGDQGWKERYYNLKYKKEIEAFEQDTEAATEETGEEMTRVEAFAKHVAEEYVIGLCWVLMYYYRGCSSWRWFFPYHYAPFASDLCKSAYLQEKVYGKGDLNPSVNKTTNRLKVFEPSEPFRPYEQLLSVLPSRSAAALPPSLGKFMTQEDSPIADFYPIDFDYDSNGKGVKWLWIALLPFVDEKRIQEVMDSVESSLSPMELKRNMRSSISLFVHKDASPAKFLLEAPVAKTVKVNFEVCKDLAGYASATQINEKSDPMKGCARKMKALGLGESLQSKNPSLLAVNKNESLCFAYALPKVKSKFQHMGKMLPNAPTPPTVLSERDYALLMQRSSGNSGGRRPMHYVGDLYKDKFCRDESNSRSQTPGGNSSLGRGHHMLNSNNYTQNHSRGGRGGYRGGSRGGYRGGHVNAYTQNYGGNSGNYGHNPGRMDRNDRYSANHHVGNSWGSMEPRQAPKRGYNHMSSMRGDNSRGRADGPGGQSYRVGGNYRVHNNNNRGGSQRGGRGGSTGMYSHVRGSDSSRGANSRQDGGRDFSSVNDVFDHIESKVKKPKYR